MVSKSQDKTIGDSISSLRGIRGEVIAHRADCLDREEMPEAEDWSRIARRLYVVIRELEDKFGYEGGVKRWKKPLPSSDEGADQDLADMKRADG